jgi:hypothetical protein
MDYRHQGIDQITLYDFTILTSVKRINLYRLHAKLFVAKLDNKLNEY